MRKDKVTAVLNGAAIGDAMGWPVEFRSLAEIKAAYGPQGIHELPDPAWITDDTQMTMALAEGLLEAGPDADLDSKMNAVGRHFVAWLVRQDDPNYARAPGVASMKGSAQFQRGVPWRESGGIDSKGCGAAMRVAPIGLLYAHDPERLREVAAASAMLTHRHPTAIASAIGAAAAVQLAFTGTPVSDLMRAVYDFTLGVSDEFSDTLLKLGHVLSWADEEAAMRHIGAGWVGDQAVALALYCVLRYPDDFVGCVRRGANLTGDSDSVASIAGGISAALLGPDALPPEWVARLEVRNELVSLGERLSAARS